MSKRLDKLNYNLDYYSYIFVFKVMAISGALLYVLSAGLLFGVASCFITGRFEFLIIYLILGVIFIFLAKGFKQVSERLPRWDPDTLYQHDDDGWVINTSHKNKS